MIRWLKWAWIVAAVLVVGAVVWWATGSIAASGGVGGLVMAFLGWKRDPKPTPADARDDIADQLTDGLEATEARIESERVEMEREAIADLRAAADALEERVNAPVDPDSAPWRRRRTD